MFANLKGFLATQRFFEVEFDSSSHFLKMLHGAEDSSAVDVAGNGAFGNVVKASPDENACLMLISFSSRLD